jgi:hypothetical protein
MEGKVVMNRLLSVHHVLRLVVAGTIFLSLLSNAVNGFAQPTQALAENWRATDYNFNGKMLEIDSNSNAYVLGDTPATNILNIRKYSPAGVLLWQTIYDDPTYNLSGIWITVDGGGNAIVLANIVRSTDGQPSGWLTLKYDTNGNLLWVNPLSRAFSNAARVIVDFSGNIYVAGTGVLTKYSPTGATLWQDNSGAVGQPSSMALSIDGARVAIAGKTSITGLDFRAVMYDSNGSLLWTNTSATPYPANDVTFSQNFDYATYFASGTYFPQDPNPYQMAIVKLDAAGNQIWARNYSVGDSTYRLAMAVDGVVATGVDSSGYLDWMTIKTDFNGNLLWSQRFDGAKINDETPNMLVVKSSGVYVTGKGGPNPSSGTLSNLKGVVVKYSASGVPQWALWDDLAGGKALRVYDIDFGQITTLTTLGWGYLTTAHYTPTGLTEPSPGTPTNLTGTATTSDVTLSFSDSATNEFWVEVERCAGLNCTDFVGIGQTRGENATSFRDAAVSGGTNYTYRVRARGFMGASEYSNRATFTIAGTATPPPAPSNFAAIAASKSQINLSWSNNSTHQTGVHIERCRGASCTNFAPISTVAGTATSYADVGLASNTVYRYRVNAYNAAGSSPYSNIASGKTLRR